MSSSLHLQAKTYRPPPSIIMNEGPWTEGQSDILRRCRAKNLSLEETARICKRPIKSILIRAVALRVPFPTQKED